MDALGTKLTMRRRASGLVRGSAAALAIPMGIVLVIGIWTQVVLLDAGGIDSYIDEALRQETVTVAMGERLGDQLVDLYTDNLSLAVRAPEALRDEAELLDRVITDEIRARSVSLADTPAFRAVLAEAATGVHASMADALSGQGTDGPTVVEVNLVPTAVELFRGLQDAGAWPESPVIEPIDPTASPEDQRRQLEKSLGFDLPSELATLTLVDDSPDDQKSLDTVRNRVDLVRTLTWISLVAWVLLVGVASWCKSAPQASLMTLALVLTGSASGVWVIAGVAPAFVASSVDDQLWADAIRDITRVALSSLRLLSVCSAAVGVAAIVAVAVTGRLRSTHPVGTA